MSAARVRRPIHRGSVLAAGLFVDAGSMGVEAARARLLGAMGAGARVFVARPPAPGLPGGPPAGRRGPAGGRHGDPAAEEWIIACLRAPVRMATTASPAGLLVRYGELLSSAPLEEDELAALNTVGPAAVIVAGGEAVVLPLDEAYREDPAAWIDVSDFEVPGDIVSLGHEHAAPAVGIAARRVDVRASLGVEAAPPDLARIRNALLAGAGRGEGAGAGGAGRGERSGAGGGAGARRAGAWGRLLARIFAGLAAVLERLLPAGDNGSARGATGMEKARSGKALAVREAPPDGGAPGPSWLSALSRALRALALRALVWSRLAGVVGRRQAEYLSRMLEMFERGDLESALRHAIPLGGGDGGEAPPPALGALSPRRELTISPARARALTALYSGPDLLAELRLRYRRAFEQLEQAGEVEKAAFVLAELLGAHEEAVSFLERHGRLRLAAEIAEARGLPPGLVVRQWFLAGDARRAIRLARVHGAFADAVHRLEASGRAWEATALRLAWADALADAGQLAAAVQVIWPVKEARPLAAEWIDRAIALGGPIAAQMALRKARLFPETFPEARDRVLALLREPGEEGALITRALAAEISASRGDPSSRVLATPVLRALLRAGPPGGDEGARRALAECMADASGDALMREELRLLWKKTPGVTPATPVAARPHAASEAVPTGPLRASPEPRLVRRGEADAGALAIHDATELPDGRLLVALGELGAWLVSREGRVLARFAEPAEHVVMSDQGDRALLLARRGEATRIARLDLAGRRKQAWCDARITAFARDFDGSMWYVALEDTLYAIDATQAGWEHLWQSREPGAWVHGVARDGQRLSAVLVGGPAEVAVWTWDLPSHRLRSRDAAGDEARLAYVVSVTPSGDAAVLVRPVEGPSGVELASVLRLRKQGKELPLPEPPPDVTRRTALSEEWVVTPAGEGGAALDVLDADHARPRLRVELAGGRPAGRLRGDHLLAFDDRGRLLVISLRTGGVIREIRLS